MSPSQRRAFDALLRVAASISQLSSLMMTSLMAFLAAASAAASSLGVFYKNYLFGVWFAVAVISFIISIIISLLILLRGINSIHDDEDSINIRFYRISYVVLLFFLFCGIMSSTIYVFNLAYFGVVKDKNSLDVVPSFLDIDETLFSNIGEFDCRK